MLIAASEIFDGKLRPNG